MSNKHGPTRSDLTFRFWFSVSGLALLVGALVFRGMPQGPAGWEAIGLAAVFFGGEVVLAVWKMLRQKHSLGGAGHPSTPAVESGRGDPHNNNHVGIGETV
ncbi:MAG: hypothetical protein AB3N09_06840, partial [Tateyamaria sp.]